LFSKSSSLRISLAAVALVAWGAAEGSAASVVVTVGERSTTFTAQQLTAIADVAANDWQPGASGERHPDAVALRRLIESAGGDPASVRAVAVTADGAAVELAGSQLEDPPPFGAGPPIPVLLWSDAAGIHFARPVGRQLLDRVDVAPGATMAIAVTGATRLSVRVRPSATRVEAGATVTLTALVDDPPAGRLAYRWDLGDGRRGRGPQLQHAFRRPGRYAVTATATAPSATGTSAPVEIVVGRAPRAPRRGGDGSGDVSTGGGRARGADDADAGTPPSGAAAAPAAPPRRPRPRTAAQERRVAPRRDAPPPSPAAVGGELLASASTAPPPAASAATAPAARTSASPGGEPLASVPWQAVAVVALLAGGAVFEWRYGRRGVMP